MSFKATHLVCEHSKQKGSALLCLMMIADYADDRGKCSPGLKCLADKCRMSERQICRILRILVKNGELAIETRRNDIGADIPSVYTLHVGGDKMTTGRGTSCQGEGDKMSYGGGGCQDVIPNNDVLLSLDPLDSIESLCDIQSSDHKNDLPPSYLDSVSMTQPIEEISNESSSLSIEEFLAMASEAAPDKPIPQKQSGGFAVPGLPSDPQKAPTKPVGGVRGAEIPETAATGLESKPIAKKRQSTKAPKPPKVPKENGQFAIVLYHDAYNAKFQCKGCKNTPGSVETCVYCKGKGHLVATLAPIDRNCLMWIGREFGVDTSKQIIANYFATESTALYDQRYPVAFLKNGINIYKDGPGPNKTTYASKSKSWMPAALAGTDPTWADLVKHQHETMSPEILAMFADG